MRLNKSIRKNPLIFVSAALVSVAAKQIVQKNLVVSKHTFSSHPPYVTVAERPACVFPSCTQVTEPPCGMNSQGRGKGPGLSSRIALGSVHRWRASYSTDKVCHMAKAKGHGRRGCSSRKSRRSHSMAGRTTLLRGRG